MSKPIYLFGVTIWRCFDAPLDIYRRQVEYYCNWQYKVEGVWYAYHRFDERSPSSYQSYKHFVRFCNSNGLETRLFILPYQIRLCQ